MCEGSRTGMTAALTQKHLWDLRVILHSPQLLLHNLLLSEMGQYLHHRLFPSCLLTCTLYPYWHSDQLSSSIKLDNGKMTTSEGKDCPCLRVCLCLRVQCETSGCWARSPLSQPTWRSQRLLWDASERGWSILRRLDIIDLTICEFKTCQKLLEWCQVVWLPLKSVKTELCPPKRERQIEFGDDDLDTHSYVKVPVRCHNLLHKC